jgi:hypothetical protein
MGIAPDVIKGRHPGVTQIARYFDYGHLPVGPLRGVSGACSDLAETLIGTLPDGPELTAGLRKLLEAKDCFVRAALPPTGT